MPALHILKGANEGGLAPLDGDKFILGRNPDCGVVIPMTSVSREHAVILRIQGDAIDIYRYIYGGLFDGFCGLVN